VWIDRTGSAFLLFILFVEVAMAVNGHLVQATSGVASQDRSSVTSQCHTSIERLGWVWLPWSQTVFLSLHIQLFYTKNS
jgi:hypothetical protein